MGDLKSIVPSLLAWWDEGHADLPWRNHQDPYAIWVAEIMLQQTQIATVIPYFQRWMKRFPTVDELATASLDDVLQLWEGLGYYSRARHLHQAAQTVASEHGGRLPQSVAALRKLKGIGPYTAGAIASIAFDLPAPVVDGNVARVLSRLLDLEEDVTKSNAKKRLWVEATALVEGQSRPGDFNQALMELGQQICLRSAPRCHLCPVREHCLAHRNGTQLERPVRPPRKNRPHYDEAAGAIWRADGRLLIVRRPLDGLLGGLWRLPGARRRKGEALLQALLRATREGLSLDVDIGEPFARIVEVLTLTSRLPCTASKAGTEQATLASGRASTRG